MTLNAVDEINYCRKKAPVNWFVQRTRWGWEGWHVK